MPKGVKEVIAKYVHDNTLPYGDINQSTAKLWMVNPLCVFYSFALNRNNRTMGHH